MHNGEVGEAEEVVLTFLVVAVEVLTSPAVAPQWAEWVGRVPLTVAGQLA